MNKTNIDILKSNLNNNNINSSTTKNNINISFLDKIDSDLKEYLLNKDIYDFLSRNLRIEPNFMTYPLSNSFQKILKKNDISKKDGRTILKRILYDFINDDLESWDNVEVNYIKSFNDIKDLKRINYIRQDEIIRLFLNHKSDFDRYHDLKEKTSPEKINRLNTFINKNIFKIKKFNEMILNLDDNYISRSKRNIFKNEYVEVYSQFSELDFSLMDNRLNHLEEIRLFKDIYEDLLNYNGLEDEKRNYIKDANERYIEKEFKANSDFFDDILNYSFDNDDSNSPIKDKISLDEDQRRAVVIDEENTQIVAGAGTGKTTTLQAKLKYLTKVKGIEENKILCLSFSNASVDDLTKKVYLTLGPNEVDIRNFHSLGIEILKDSNENTRVREYALDEVLDSYFKEKILNDKEKIKKIIEFFSYYFYIPISELENDVSEKYEKEEMVNFFTIKDTVENFIKKLDDESKFYHFRKIFGKDDVKITENRERVKSIEELVIANFLFLHGIDYEYERKFSIEKTYRDNFLENIENLLFQDESPHIPKEIKNRYLSDLCEELGQKIDYKYFDYYPDFYLPKYNIHIEHFGVDKKCEAPWIKNDVEAKKYKDSILWKRKICEKYGIKLIETYSYYTQERRLLKRLEEKLKDEGVEFKEMDYDALYETLICNRKLKEFNDFFELIKTFINLFKGNGFNIDEIGNDVPKKKFNEFKKRNKETNDSFVRERRDIFLELVEDIYYYYHDYLDQIERIDFNDMINKAIRELYQSKNIREYEYILIDEYQDTSETRYKLIRAIKDIYPNTKLIVVGDDWQSIYKFTGCNIKLFTEFHKYFEEPELVKIQKTYRNSQELLDVSGNFMYNEEQIEKKLVSSKHRNKPFKLLNYDGNCQKVFAFEKAIKQIVKDYKKSNSNEELEILVLGRNNSDINNLIENNLFDSEVYDNYTKIRYKNTDLNITFRTIHKSKGLDAPYVILVNLKNSVSGFPNKISNDEIIDFCFEKNKEKKAYAEERRLFYVALTRTKNDVYLLVPKTEESIFVKELREKKINEKYLEKIKFEFSEEDCQKIKLDYSSTNHYRNTGLKCPICAGTVRLVRGKYNKFFACSRNACDWYGGPWPKESSIEELKFCRNCPECGGILVVRPNQSRDGYFLGCSFFGREDCRANDTLTEEEQEEIRRVRNIRK